MHVKKIYEVDSRRDLNGSLIQRKHSQVNSTVWNLWTLPSVMQYANLKHILIRMQNQQNADIANKTNEDQEGEIIQESASSPHPKIPVVQGSLPGGS